jgi:hypothetical protein
MTLPREGCNEKRRNFRTELAFKDLSGYKQKPSKDPAIRLFQSLEYFTHEMFLSPTLFFLVILGFEFRSFPWLGKCSTPASRTFKFVVCIGF